MRKIYYSELIQILESLRIQTGDSLLVHSALQFLGQPEYDPTPPGDDFSGVSDGSTGSTGSTLSHLSHLPQRPSPGVRMYFDAICQVIQCKEGSTRSSSPFESTLPPGSTLLHLPQGTLAVPAFNFGFARGECYDSRSTPSQGMGTFSEFIRQLPEMQRTSHPMQSLAVIGKWAADLVGRDTASAFDTESAFERLLELDSKLLLLGADIQAVSMVHYSEQRAQVPYRLWKEFTGPVNTKHGQVIKTYQMFVRDMAIDPKLDLAPIQNELEKRGLWHSVTVNYGKISSCLLNDFVRITDELLHADPWVLVSNRPVRKYSSAPTHQAEAS